MSRWSHWRRRASLSVDLAEDVKRITSYQAIPTKDGRSVVSGKIMEQTTALIIMARTAVAQLHLFMDGSMAKYTKSI